MQRGAQSSVNYSQGSLKDAVKKLVGSGGVNVAIDMVGGDVFLESVRRYVQCSVQNGSTDPSASSTPTALASLCLCCSRLL